MDQVKALRALFSRIGFKGIFLVSTLKYLTFYPIIQRTLPIKQMKKYWLVQSLDPSDESVINIFQHLSNSLLRMADCSKKVSLKAKNEIYDPISTFTSSYSELNHRMIQKLKKDQNALEERYQELSKTRQNYLSSSEKLEKNKQVQSKLIIKVESGDLSQLDKFNQNLKKISESINQNEQQYQACVKSVNDGFMKMRKNLNETMKSISYNEQSRISFYQKNVVNAISNLETFSTCFDPEIKKKLKQTLKKFEDEEKNQLQINKNLNVKIALLAASKFEQQFISFQELARRRIKKSMQEQNSYLQQIFNNVKPRDKQIIGFLISPWFGNTQKSIGENQLSSQEEEVNVCTDKILSFQSYSFYFVEQVYQKTQDMTSFYCKLDDDSFFLLLHMFQAITTNIEVESNTSNSLLGVQFLYKMATVSLRVMWKKGKGGNQKGKPIQLLCQYYGKVVKKFRDPRVLSKVYQYILRKKATMKRTLVHSQSRGMINSLTKGIASMMGRKKQPHLTEDQIFNCQQQITQLLANLQVPSDVSIPFIKHLLGSSESRSLQYLKGILFSKKDQEQRQKIFYRTEVKEKIQERMKKVINEKKIAEECIWITAKRGFFGKKQLNLRLVSKQFKSIHCQILSHLKMSPQQKWMHLIPLDKEINYEKMKQILLGETLATATQQIITLDVNRSLPNHSQRLPQPILISLLRVYAYFHHQISYCQGMNYIAGYLYLKANKQEKAYRIFEFLMQFRFKELFMNEFEVLKVKMYQFERLLSIFHPEISDHFKKQSITSECYIISWMITLFASSYQYTQESYLIDALWERFIIWGWGEFYRFVLSLFNLYKEDLIELTYDKALHFLGEMGKSKMFLSSCEDYQNEYPNNDVIEGMDQYPITEEMLETLANEYKLSS